MGIPGMNRRALRPSARQLAHSLLGAALLVGLGSLLPAHLLPLVAAVPLFTRFGRGEILGHERRDLLFHYIHENPGRSLSDLARDVGLKNGVLLHHLHVLEAQEFIKSIREGMRRRYFVRGPRIAAPAYLTPIQSRILETVRAQPGLTQRELSGVVGLPRQSVLYHTRRLAGAGLLDLASEGRLRRHFAKPTQSPDESASGGA